MEFQEKNEEFIKEKYEYCNKLIQEKRYEEAIKNLEVIYEIDPKNPKALFQLFLRKLQNNDIEEAVKYFFELYKLDQPEYRNDHMFYLYLLNIITELPKEYQELAKSLGFDDIKVRNEDRRFPVKYYYNQVRTSVMSGKLVLAYQQINNIIRTQGRITIGNFTAKMLLNAAITQLRNEKIIVEELIKEKHFFELAELMQNLDNKRNLSYAEHYILELANDINYIIETGEIPIDKTPVFRDSLPVFVAISDKDYKLAFELCDDYLTTSNKNKEENAIYLLLAEINRILYNTNIVTSNSIKDKIKESLIQLDFDNVILSLRKYLDLINKKEYELIIVNLVKIGILDNDISFSKAISAINNIDSLDLHVDEYKQIFYEYLEAQKFEQAKLSLDILTILDNNLDSEIVELIMFELEDNVNRRQNI